MPRTSPWPNSETAVPQLTFLGPVVRTAFHHNVRSNTQFHYHLQVLALTRHHHGFEKYWLSLTYWLIDWLTFLLFLFLCLFLSSSAQRTLTHFLENWGFSLVLPKTSMNAKSVRDSKWNFCEMIGLIGALWGPFYCTRQSSDSQQPMAMLLNSHTRRSLIDW